MSEKFTPPPEETYSRRYTDLEPGLGEIYIALVEEGLMDRDGYLSEELPKSMRKAITYIVQSQTEKEKLKEQLEIYKGLAETDNLTGIPNGRAFDELAPKLIETQHENGNDPIIFMMDMDKLKFINDTYGHDIGDIVIKTFAKAGEMTFRDNDLFARWGGDEFSALLAGIKKEDAILVAQRLDQNYKELIDNNEELQEKLGDKYEELKQLGCTACIGAVAVIKDYYDEDGKIDLEKIKKVADQNMYIVKNGGRNGICIDGNTVTKLREL